MSEPTPNQIEMTPELRKRIDAFLDEHSGDPIGGVGTSVLFEDDKVKIWDMKLEPGQASDLHRHDHDYYLVIFSGDVIAGVPPRDQGDPFVFRLSPGVNTVSVPKGGTEWALNLGDETYYEILVELKNT